MVLGWIVATVLVIVLLLLMRIIRRLCRGDADLVLQRCSLVPSFYRRKVVWVTGASSGIGEELCRQLSVLGATVILSARSKEKMIAIKESLKSPDDARIVVLDLLDPVSVEAAVDEANSLFGRVDILINNAGISMKGTLLDMPHEHGCKVMAVNFLNTVLLTKLVLPVMLKQGSGQIVNMSSVGGKTAYGFGSYYYASKHALNGLMDSLRLELLRSNIHVSNVLPGPVRTMVSHNSLIPSGETYGKGVGVIDKGMPAPRCAELVLIGVSNYLKEMWIARGASLIGVYLAQYYPSLHYHMLAKKTMKLLDKK